MSRSNSVLSDVIDVVSDQAKVERAQVSPTTDLSDLGLESLDIVELIFALEEKFDIELDFNANDPDAASIANPNSIAAAIEGLIDEG